MPINFLPNELIPFPYTEETLSFIIEKTNRVQEYLNQPIMYENVSRYVTYRQNTLSEAEFLNELSTATGCGILLDINNLYVNWYNHGDDPDKYLHSMNTKNIWQMHLGGFQNKRDICWIVTVIKYTKTFGNFMKRLKISL